MSAFGTKGHFVTEFQCPLSGVKRALCGRAAMSAFDPKQTLGQFRRKIGQISCEEVT
jgi:hypothetical protein